MRAMFVCAGSGGHINPALATADALCSLFPGTEVIFVGAGRRMEKQLIPAAGYDLENIEIVGLERGFKPRQLLKNVNAAKLLFTAVKRSRTLLKKYKPDVVLGTGGAVCYPVLRAASELNVPTVLHESNASPGLAVKAISNRVSKVFTAFPNTEQLYKKPSVVRTIPTPVRGEFGKTTREQARREMGIPSDAKLAVSFWGSLGGAGVNAIMRGVVARNARERRFWQLHAVGGDSKRRETFLSGIDLPAEIDIRVYIDDMPRVMAAADLVICRAGGSTVAEIARVGRASVLIPSPYVTSDHQTPNAEAFKNAGASEVVREQNCNADELFTIIDEMLHNKQKLELMEHNSLKLGSADAAERLAVEMYQLVK